MCYLNWQNLLVVLSQFVSNLVALQRVLHKSWIQEHDEYIVVMPVGPKLIGNDISSKGSNEKD